MMSELLQHNDRQILIVNKYGKRDIVMFYDAACDILHDYHKMERSENEVEEKQRLVRNVTDTIKNDIKDTNRDTSMYF